jgi:exonuclease SbcC
MIPVRLTLRNFLSYGEAPETIEFDGIHVACLCGQNGNGKSALLDAITWSLWGQARSNSADDLVRLNQTSMQVELEFLLDGQHFRVIRKRNRGKNSASDLQFQMRQSDGQWRALTGQGVRGTQERITQILRMDYETFINSAFILQGRADEFARKTPGDRKRILGEILSLSVYDQLYDSARARRSEALMRVNALEAQLTQLERDYARLPDLETQVAKLTSEQALLQLELEKFRATLQGVLVEKTRLDARRKERDDLLRRLQRAEGELGSLRQQLATTQRKVDGCKALLAKAGEIRTQAQELAAVSHERDGMAARLGDLRLLEQQQNLLERQLQEARSALDTKLQLARQRVRELRAQVEHLPTVVRDLEDLERQVTALDRLAEERGALQAKLQELAAERAAAEADERRAGEDLVKADERFGLLKGAQAICPLCEGELPESKRKELGWKLKEERNGLKEAQASAIQRQADAKRIDAVTRKALQDLEGKLKTGQLMRDRLAQARQKHLQLEEAGNELTPTLELAESLEQLLTQDDFEPERRESLAAVRKQVGAVGYDQSRHESLAKRAQQLAGAERNLHLLEQAEAALPEEQRQAETLTEAIRAREEAIAEDRAARAEADRDLTRLPEVEAQAKTLEGRVAQSERTEAEMRQRLGAAAEARQRCSELGEIIDDKKKEREVSARDQALYEELAKAFGRNGIQALIIENAIPEIETETNALLARMSENALSVRLNTQRELKSGAQSETLEIEISDGMGPRKYELYSGGEAFRVNFALRIALSKLLARRAGARLETLVIDEGFGSQDSDGRQRLVEAINAVQDDFAKILVITHIDELKEVFPTRIEVSKGMAGSTVVVY